MPPKMPICSPVGLDEYKKTKSCFTIEALRELASSWNRMNPNTQIANVPTLSRAALYTQLNNRLKPTCGTGRLKELKWIQQLGGLSQNRVASRFVMPPKPTDWDKNPHKWLNNYDINHILSRFEGDPKYPYKLLGVVPIDFQGTDSAGNALYPELHKFDLSKYVGKYKFLGLITNLDTHEGPGTHWTSTFIGIDPSLPCFGAYYYDSTFTSRTDVHRVPPEIRKFFKMLKQQADALPTPNAAHKFKRVFYKPSHQHQDTECGMFSIFYQVHWLRTLIKDLNATHKNIDKLKITDEQAFKLREFFFSTA